MKLLFAPLVLSNIVQAFKQAPGRRVRFFVFPRVSPVPKPPRYHAFWRPLNKTIVDILKFILSSEAWGNKYMYYSLSSLKPRNQV